MSRFYGIIIRMFAEFNVPYHIPHFPAYYQDDLDVFSIDPIELISEALPKRQQRFVEAWAELRQAELWAAWHRLQAGQKPLPIEPLK